MKKLLIPALLLFSVSCFAQGPGDPGGNPDTPIDGGISLLIAGGIGYGIKKINDARKNQKEEEKSEK